jgi:hypothetical protein
MVDEKKKDPTHGGKVGKTQEFDAVNMPKVERDGDNDPDGGPGVTPVKPFDQLVGELAQAEILKQDLVRTLNADPLSYMSYLVREVDLKHIEMPQARQKLAAWFNETSDKQFVKNEGRPRMRRLKQIMDAMFEEFHNITSQV